MQLGWRAQQLLTWMRRCGSNWFTPTSNSDAKFQIIEYRYHMTKLPTNPERPTIGQSDALSDVLLKCMGCQPIQCVQDMSATLESLWVALVNMYKTDTNKTLHQTSRYPQNFSRAAGGATLAAQEVLWISRSLLQCFLLVSVLYLSTNATQRISSVRTSARHWRASG